MTRPSHRRLDAIDSDGDATLSNETLSVQNIAYTGSFSKNGIDVALPQRYVASVTAALLDSAGSVIIVDAATAQQFKIHDIVISPGTNFGAGGNRNISIQDSSGTVAYSTISNAFIESQTGGTRWGNSNCTIANGDTASTAGEDIVAKYSGGTTDHSGTGSFTIIVYASRAD